MTLESAETASSKPKTREEILDGAHDKLENLKGVPTAEELEKQFAESPDIQGSAKMEQQAKDAEKESPGLMDKMRATAEKYMPTLTKVFDTIAIKPAKFIYNLAKKHPVITGIIVIGLILGWYFSAPLAYGLSGIPEEGMAAISEAVVESLQIDPTRVGELILTN